MSTNPSPEFAVGISKDRASMAVVIGRNEGERLLRCLQSLRGEAACVVYVDSGSFDGSPERARELGVEVLSLSDDRPFNAARARNAGLARLRQLSPDTDLVQFVDGDCELVPGWMAAARACLEQHPETAMVCGHLKERHPERSVYNRLCQFEWNGPTGIVKACGGVSMVRVAAVARAGGFREDLIAGEEPELCVRLRMLGWQVRKIDDDMAVHDAEMLRFGQWWRRMVRSGYASAEGAYLHGNLPERHGVRSSRSALAWGLALPTAILFLAALVGTHALWLSLAYPLQVARLALASRDAGRWLRAFFLVLGKFPEALGNLKFQRHRIGGGAPQPIEYK
jgi:GT2 family glycosyltransferase